LANCEIGTSKALETFAGCKVWTKSMRKCKDANGKFVSSFCHEILDTPTFDYTNDRYWRWLLTVFDKIAIFQQSTECTTVSQASAGFYRTIAELMGRADILKSPHGDIVRSANLYIQQSFEAFLIASNCNNDQV